MSGLEGRFLALIKNLEEEKRLADKRAKQLFDRGDRISEGDSSVEVVDLGTGYIEIKADNQQVRKDQVLGNIQPLQPAFLAYNSAIRTNKTGDGTFYTIPFDTERFDQGGDFDGSSTFTAPVDGKYPFGVAIRLQQLDSDTYESAYVQLVTSNKAYKGTHISGKTYSLPGGHLTLLVSILVDMDANDTAYVRVKTSGGAKLVDIYGEAGWVETYFSGALFC